MPFFGAVQILKAPEGVFLQGYPGIRKKALPVRDIPSNGKAHRGRGNSWILASIASPRSPGRILRHPDLLLTRRSLAIIKTIYSDRVLRHENNEARHRIEGRDEGYAR